MELRGTKSASVVVRKLKGYGVDLTASTLYQYEAGTVKAPDPGVLWALAKIYNVRLDSLIELLVAARTHPHASDPRTSTPNVVDVEDPDERSARELLELFQRLDSEERDRVREMVTLLLRARLKRKRARGPAAQFVPAGPEEPASQREGFRGHKEKRRR